MVIVILSLLFSLLISVRVAKRHSAACKRARARCRWTWTRQRRDTFSSSLAECKGLEDALRRTGVFSEVGWQQCEAAFESDLKFSEENRAVWMQYVIRASLGWMVIMSCLAFQRLDLPSANLHIFIVMSIPVLSLCLLSSQMSDPWFGNQGFNSVGLMWLRANLLDDLPPNEDFCDLRMWQRRQIQSGRNYRSARLSALRWYFADRHAQKRRGLAHLRDLLPIFELVGIGIPVLWSVALTVVAEHQISAP